ncbi:MAG: endonuclease/exonuclease/phosphatase family protein [Bacteroidales bacterium]|nr:endonuclease/exonuclease/phosphatase family protein [Bacteroidales bacterium]MBQ5944012.1 endonuclease/exonuclease/phosphatase family protein [Bacteroidales bacterium]
MKRLVYAILILLMAAPAVFAGKPGRSYVIGFYNLENLFDTYHDEGKNDYEYLPDGANQWTDVKYNKKLHNMASVIRAMADENKAFHSILGVSEIENRHVLEDLVSQPEIAGANFQIVHYDGPDRRGVDVALLYRPEHFQVIESQSIPFTLEGTSIDFGMTDDEKDYFRTRDILMVRGLLDGEMFAFFVAHLPSRLGGKSGALRDRGGEIIYRRSMELMQEFPGIKIVAMGDMNDNPTDPSMTKYVNAKEKIGEVGPENFFSPFLSMYKAGFGSLAYRGVWSIFDIIIVNSNLCNAPKGTLEIKPIVNKKYYARIFRQPFMTNQEGQYKDTPKRTLADTGVEGYSDHYPTYIVVSNKK